MQFVIIMQCARLHFPVITMRKEKQDEKKRRVREGEREKNITMAVNIESNEYSKATYKMKIMRYKIVRDSFIIR